MMVNGGGFVDKLVWEITWERLQNYKSIIKRIKQ